MPEKLPASWHDGPTRQAIVGFVEHVCGLDGSDPVPVEERVAVFDNDGTLWCEKPMPIQLDFIVRRLAEMAAAQPELRERQPWKAVSESDHGWFASAMSEHYAGDDSGVQTLAGGILAAYGGISVEDFEERSDTFLRTAQHPTLGRGYRDCAYAPMVDLLAYLTDHGFSSYIVSGGGRDFMRPISESMYGIPRERVIGSASTFAYSHDRDGGTITHGPKADYLNDGPEKPVRIWDRIGRRPLFSAGNSNGDVPMLDFTHHPDRKTFRLVVLHDDAEREFAYTDGAGQALERAAAHGWTIISMKDDWADIF